MPDFGVNLSRFDRKIQKKINKNLNDLKLIFLELAHLDLYSGNVWENRFFSILHDLGDPYSKLLLRFKLWLLKMFFFLRMCLGLLITARKMYTLFRFGGIWGERSAECGVYRMQNVENEECRKCVKWKMRSAENAECGKYLEDINFRFQFGSIHSSAKKQCEKTILTNF